MFRYKSWTFAVAIRPDEIEAARRHASSTSDAEGTALDSDTTVFLIARSADGHMAGSVPLTFHSPHRPMNFLRHISPECRPVSNEALGSVGRFHVSTETPPHARAAASDAIDADAITGIRVGLLHLLHQVSQEAGLRHWVLHADDDLQEILRRTGLVFNAVEGQSSDAGESRWGLVSCDTAVPAPASFTERLRRLWGQVESRPAQVHPRGPVPSPWIRGRLPIELPVHVQSV